MSLQSEDPTEPARHKDHPLRKVLGKTLEVNESIAEAAVDLTVVNEILRAHDTKAAPDPLLREAIAQNHEVEGAMAKAAEDLATANAELAEEVTGHTEMTEELAEVKSELEETREELSDVQAREAASRHSAMHDPLTGLANRALFEESLDQAMAIARRQDWGLAVLFLDINEFKSVNDRFGHDVGDTVLRKVASCLQAYIREGDTVCRWGGDEFTCLLLEIVTEADAVSVATNIATHLAEECDLGGAHLNIGVSIGVALFPQDGDSAAPLLKRADQAMYEAKQSGRGVVLYRECQPA